MYKVVCLILVVLSLFVANEAGLIRHKRQVAASLCANLCVSPTYCTESTSGSNLYTCSNMTSASSSSSSSSSSGTVSGTVVSASLCLNKCQNGKAYLFCLYDICSLDHLIFKGGSCVQMTGTSNIDACSCTSAYTGTYW